MSANRLGLIHVYTGNGKGKTTTGMGMALRASGQNIKVYVLQFLKGGSYTGEFIAASNFIPNITFKQFGKACIKEKKQMKLDGTVQYLREDEDCGDCRYCFLSDQEEQLLAQQAFEHAKEIIQSNKYGLIFLDEINVAISKGLISVDEVITMINNRPEKTELILTGRNAPKEIQDLADYYTEIHEVKHPMYKGIYARRGIEY